MINRFAVAALAAALLSWPRVVAAEEYTLTLDQTLQLARKRAPAVLSAQGRIEESRGRLLGASVLWRTNPLLEGGFGPSVREGVDPEVRLSLSQQVEIGGQRGARIKAANADVEREIASADDTTRRFLREAGLAFVHAVYAGERLRLAQASEAFAGDILGISERRQQAGDITRLDVSLATVALSRARADVRAAEAVKGASLGALRVLLGMAADESIAVRGDLKDRRRFDLRELTVRGSERPDLKALAAELRQAKADHRLGSAQRWPDLGIGAIYERNEGTNIVLGVVSLALPMFEHGKGLRAEAAARQRRLTGELEAAKRGISVEVQVAFDVFQRRTEAVRELEGNALTLLDENEAQIRRAYETGQIGIADFLAVRREILGARLEYLDRLLDAATAEIELEAAAGALEEISASKQ